MMSPSTLESAKTLVDLAFVEDLQNGRDATSEALIQPDSTGEARIIARGTGVVCGLEIIPLIVKRFDGEITANFELSDGAAVSAGDAACSLRGKTIDLLKIERTVLNFLGRLSGVSSLTRKFVERTQSTSAKIYDTRKTTPGWRALEKYAVHCGGGENHRMGLYDAILIKDNHLAALRSNEADETNWIDSVRTAFQKIRQQSPEMTVQIEVDTLEQLRHVLELNPDIVLLDNMDTERLVQAVEIRGNLPVELEASGGVNMQSVKAIAKTGVDRISIGALTHSATNFDWGLDWQQT